MMKVCTKCGIEKDVSEFGVNNIYPDGVRCWCKDCCKEYQKEYRQNNKEIIAEYHRKYQKVNKEKLKEYYANYYKNTKEIIKTRVVEYNRNRLKTNEHFRLTHAIRSRILRAFSTYSRNGKTQSCSEYGIDFAAIFDRIGPRPSEEYHLDHIIPISLFDLDNPEHVRLAHVPENLRWLPGKENIQKSDSVDFSAVLSSTTLKMICQRLGIEYTAYIQKVA